MDDLIAFLRARIAEAEEIADRCEPRHWFSSRTADDPVSFTRPGVYGREHMEVSDCEQPQIAATMNVRCERHMVHHDPARVLTDLTAKKHRLKYLAHVVGGSWVDVGEHAQAEHLLRLEAAAYDWHSDYRPEWRD
ncbi:DUF6221 family protein [Microtetraspora niveoalba]|uniref:DUF6221 family protein n=1 Tax=Microtetraspora niveoalba TaxID=46175 RepID=UPI00083632F6|nr:DUF6221 family protein [Microtetraspora niveoalba]